MKTPDYTNITTYQGIPVIEHRLLDKNKVIAIKGSRELKSQHKILVGDLYTFIFKMNSAHNDSIMGSADMCFAIARAKVKEAIETTALAKSVYYEMKREALNNK